MLKGTTGVYCFFYRTPCAYAWVQVRFLVLVQNSLLWAQLTFHSVVHAASLALDEEFPGTFELLHALNEDDTDKWLKAISWTTDFLVSEIFCMMCVLGVLSNKRDCIDPVPEQALQHRVRSSLCLPIPTCTLGVSCARETKSALPA